MSSTVAIAPDSDSRPGVPFPFTGKQWLATFIRDWHSLEKSRPTYVTVDLRRLPFTSLSEWVAAIALLDRAMETVGTIQETQINLVDENGPDLLTRAQLGAVRRGDQSELAGRADWSRQVYQLLGFLESMGTSSVLNPKHRQEQGRRVIYPRVLAADIGLRAFYSSRVEGTHTVVLPITRVADKQDCRQFLDPDNIVMWRGAMGTRFERSPIFESEELWRVLCHELAVNIWEHSDSVGFVAARVVTSAFDASGRLEAKWAASFGDGLGGLHDEFAGGVLEVCVADGGRGFLDTLTDACQRRLPGPSGTHAAPPKPIDVLTFAFDEIGTCKTADESWLTESHALGRILQTVSKYGGCLRLRSGHSEVVYRSPGGPFRRRRDRLGYEPQEQRQHGYWCPGAQLHLLLPLFPRFLGRTGAARSVLETTLPVGFLTQPQHPRGHLVPLRDRLDLDVAVGGEEQRSFREAVTALAKDLIDRIPPQEPLVLDLSEIQWNEAQLETLLHLMQNVLQSRPWLLVEVDPRLARSVVDLETLVAPTRLDGSLRPRGKSVTGRAFSEMGAHRYLETYSRVQSAVLALDRDGARYIFGLSDAKYGPPLLGLIDTPMSVADLLAEHPDLTEGVLGTILHASNPLFQVDTDGRWRCSWDASALAVQGHRAMSVHFVDAVARTGAWRGANGLSGGDASPSRGTTMSTPARVERAFYLPWLGEWRASFFDASRLLSRERHADEAAQRLLYRLAHGLRLNGATLDEVGLLACVSSPAMLLGTAIHRWWPSQQRPMVADISSYALLGEPGDLPQFPTRRGVVIVQSVLDTHTTSTALAQALASQGMRILCILALAQFVDRANGAVVTSPDSGWATPNPDQPHLPRHAMVELPRPRRTSPTQGGDQSGDFWVEPRSLHPIRMTTLRLDFSPDRDSLLERKLDCLRLFDDPVRGCLFLRAGHYVYGPRHYPVAVDIATALRGEIGDQIAAWLAEVCEGAADRSPAPWDSKLASSLTGRVTHVLMPLHSQIHYLWPRTQALLAQRNLRQPAWFLESTRFTGAGAAHFLSQQLKVHLFAKAREAKEAERSGRPSEKLRILVLDDAVATGQTAEAIVATLLRALESALDRLDWHPADSTSPVAWIRYFVVVNQLANTHHRFWRHTRTIGRLSIPVAFEEFAPFMGVPVHSRLTCPLCQDRARLLRLQERAGDSPADHLRPWVERRLTTLLPVAVDAIESPDLPPPLDHPISVLPSQGPTSFPGCRHADAAIWRFHELMHLSYPATDVLDSLDATRQIDRSSTRNDPPPEIAEYERYRWAVFHWCLHNWERVTATDARASLARELSREIATDSNTVAELLELCSLRYTAPTIHRVVQDAITRLADLRLGREGPSAADPRRIAAVVALDTGLTAFFLSLPRVALASESEPGPLRDVLHHLRIQAQRLRGSHPDFLDNLLRLLTRPRRYAQATWALETLAESLFRGRDPDYAPAGHHMLLPRLISTILQRGGGDLEDQRLLHGSLSLFLAALDDIAAYCSMSNDVLQPLRAAGAAVQDWLSGRREYPGEQLRDLDREVAIDGNLYRYVSDLFHWKVEWIRDRLIKELQEDPPPAQHVFQCDVEPRATGFRVLTHVRELMTCIQNLAIDPARRAQQASRSAVKIGALEATEAEPRIRFRILADFADPQTTARSLRTSRNNLAERHVLEQFGVRFSPLPLEPTEGERRDGFTTVLEFDAMVGFAPGR